MRKEKKHHNRKGFLLKRLFILLKRICNLGILLSLLFLTNCSNKKEKNNPPNIILILADDLGYADLGYTGCKDFKTPNIDALAYGGVICSNGYASHSFCAPTRAGLITGRNQHRFGFQINPGKTYHDHGLPIEQITLPKLLNQVNYKSALVGKWHLGVKEEHHPLNRGFDEFYGFLSGGHDYFKHDSNDLNKHSYNQPLEYNDSLIGVEGYLTDQLTNHGVDFIQRNQESPFFLFMSYNAPHVPFQAPEQYLNRVSNIKDKERRTYAAMITAMDDGVGKIMETLRKTGLEENTLVFFMSDNGGAPFSPVNNHPFRGVKGTVLEGGVHVPYVVYWKGKLQPHIYEKPVVSYDVFSTALALAGVVVPSDRPIDSQNLLPYLTGTKQEKVPHEHLFWKQADFQWALRTPERKAIYIKEEAPYLFDMQKDPTETNDIGKIEIEELNQMTKTFNQWNEKLPKPKYEDHGIAVKVQSLALENLKDTRKENTP